MVSKDKKALLAHKEAGRAPVKLKSTAAIAFVNGKKRMMLVNANGTRTALGKYWEDELKGHLPAFGFGPAPPIREGNTETVLMEDGKKATLRRWLATGEYEFTKTWKAFYRKQVINYVIQVAVKIKGVRKDGTTNYTLKSHMPVEKSGVTTAQLPMNLSSAERDRRLKEMTSEKLGGLEGTLYEMSRETWT